MINLEDATLFNEVLNYYKNVSIESKKQLKDNIFLEDEDDSLNEDYFESLSKGYALNGLDNYYSSFFKFIDLMKNNVTLLNATEYNDLYDHPEFASLRKNSEILKNVLHNHLSYNLKSVADYSDDGISKWENFASQHDIEVEDDIKNINSLVDQYIDNVEKEVTPLISIIRDFVNRVDTLNQLHDRLAQSPDNQEIHNDIQTEIKSLHENLLSNKKLIDYYQSKELMALISIEDFDRFRRDLYECFENIYEKGCANKKTNYSLADQYMHTLSTSSGISKFLVDKTLSDDLVLNVDVNAGQYRNVKMFKDDSMIVTDTENKVKRVFSNIEAAFILNDIIENDIKQSLRKTPVISKKFIELYQDNNRKPVSVYLVMNTYLNNEHVLKSNKFNIIDALQTMKDDVNSKQYLEERKFDDHCESLDDEMNAIIKNHKVKQYAHSIASNKYMHLYDEKSYKIIEAIYDLKIESSVLQDNIGKKIAAYHTPAEFNTGLKSLLNTFSDFTPEKIREKALACKADIIVEDDNKIIIKIEDFKQSKIMGSSSWCIARDEHYFKSYVGDYNHQYFIYDFNKDSSDNESMIGITLTPELDCEAAHAKNDDDVTNDKKLTVDNIAIIVKHDSGWYQKELLKREKNAARLKSIAP
jgi:cell division septum initiation protein DivIVA